MQKSNYSNISDVLSARLNDGGFAHYSRRVIGDFNALARWIDSHAAKQSGLHLRDLRLLRDKMLNGERYAVDQILKDMTDIELAAQKYNLPLDVTISVLKGQDEPDIQCGAYGLVKCCYLGPVDHGFALTDIWRQTQAAEISSLSHAYELKAEDSLRLVLVAK